MIKKEIKKTAHGLYIELVKLQKEIISSKLKLLVILEGRDTAGKDGTIKNIIKHLSPRETKVVALGKPSDREEKEWYFQRYVLHLPIAGELTLLTGVGTIAWAWKRSCIFAATRNTNPFFRRWNYSRRSFTMQASSSNIKEKLY
jgi:hypothetical protein